MTARLDPKQKQVPARSGHIALARLPFAPDDVAIALIGVVADQVACYLETENERNVAFYRKQGFDVIVNGEEAGTTGVRFWSFSRTPKPGTR